MTANIDYASLDLTKIPAGQPPPGVTADFINPPNQNSSTYALHASCLTLVTIAFVARLWSRLFVIKTFGVEDYLCVAAYMLSVIFSALLLEGNAQGLGRHIWDISVQETINGGKFLTIAEFFYISSATCVKLSVLFFYRGVFPPKRMFLNWFDIGIAWTICTNVPLFFGSVFNCVPLNKSWAFYVDGRCWPSEILPYLSGAVNVVTDVYILLIPIPIVWKLQMPLARKIRISAVFGMGTFACVASLLRLIMTKELYSTTDRTWNLGNIAVWAVIEINVGIICACCFSFPALFKQYVPSEFSNSMKNLLSRNTKSWPASGKSGSENSRANRSEEKLGGSKYSSDRASSLERGESQDANTQDVEMEEQVMQITKTTDYTIRR